MAAAAVIHEAGLAEIDARTDELIALLIDAVESGASIGFLAPLSDAEAREYWRTVSEAQNRIVLVAQAGRRIVGAVQVDLCERANGTHRAEILKLMVHRRARRQGLGRALMEAAARAAAAQGRTLLVLDTRSGDPAEVLYRELGYQTAGVIPRYARSSTGEMHDTVMLYKELNAPA